MSFLNQSKIKILNFVLVGILFLLICSSLSAQTTAPATPASTPKIEFGDTAWVLISTALVLLMTPGLAFFYGGMVRRKNILNILMQCMIIICVISLQWILFGYSLAFGPGKGFWGGLQWLGLNGVGMAPNPDYAATIPHQLFMIFQGMFAVITPALIVGAFAERIKFSSFLVFTIIWATFIYDPVCHWVWGANGWLHTMGALDFAGGIVVHINAGIAALITAVVIGRRKNLDHHTPSPHNMPFVILGTGLLWFGWFGFNAGSALAANGLAVNAFVVSNTAAAAGGLTWALIEWIRAGKPTIFGTASGIIAGLATITPAAGFVSVMPAILIGFLASVFCYISVSMIKPFFRYDDSLDAFGVHCVGGIVGTLATGLFASKLINSCGANGLFYGNPKQFMIQLIAVLVTIAYTAITTLILYYVIDKIMGIRVKEQDELIGLDLTQHQERAYTILE